MYDYNYWGSPFGAAFGAGIGVLIAVALLWSLVWKGLALWKAARHGHKWWFVALMVVNTLGILEILYIYIFSKKTRSQVPPAGEPHVHEHHHHHGPAAPMDDAMKGIS